MGLDPAASGTQTVLSVPGAGTYVLLRPDSAPLASPPDVVPGEVLAGTPVAVYDAALDVRRHIAYLACYNAGVCLVDLSNPYAGADRANPYGILDADGNQRDDRILGFLRTAPGSRSTLVVDSETGLVYVGEQGSDSGLKVVGAEPPRMEFVLDDPQHPGQFQVPGYLSAFDGDKPRLALWLPGGAGESLPATLELYDRKGMPEQPQVVGQDEQGNDILAPVSTVYRPGVTLLRQSRKKTDPKYNFYLQNNAPPDAVELAMIYDPAAPNAPDLMVTKQGGTLRALATPPAWHHANTSWGRTLRLDKAVSRPWVEWQYDVLAGAPAEEAPLPLPSDYSGPSFLAKDQERQITFRYLDTNSHAVFPAQVAVSFADPTVGTITPASLRVNGPNVPGLKFNIKASEETQNGQAVKINVQVTYANGQSRRLYQIPVYAFTSGMAVDYNRDGEIHFDNDPSDPKAGTDHVPDGKYYQFWLNDNFDYQKEPESGDESNLKAYQDERPIYQERRPTGQIVIVNGDPTPVYQEVTVPDYALDHIAVERDLEDFTRLHVRKTPAMGKGTSKIQYVFYFDRNAEGQPQIKLYHPPFASDDYLKVESAAEEALSSERVGQAEKASGRWSGLVVPPEVAVAGGAAQRTLPFLFEGMSRGRGKLWLELRYEGVRLAKYAVPLELKPVGEFVEEYSVLQPDDHDEEHDPLATARTEHALPDPGADGSRDYILWVHGWNWADWEKKAYGYSTFKRLYWLGYKGTFGIYKWPNTYGNVVHIALTFDDSERHALLSGEGLKNLILALKQRGFNVHLYAHSQGCMVTSEALRQIALDESVAKPVVDSMTFSQAAVSARMYDGNYPEYDDWGGLANNVLGIPINVIRLQGIFGLRAYEYFKDCPVKPQWPDLHGHFPFHLENPAKYPQPTYDPYFKPVQNAVQVDAAGSRRMFNFFNEEDYPTGNYYNEPLFHIQEAFSGSWLLDQLIKPFRALTYPLYRDRAYKMVYGTAGLTYNEKVFFVRDSARQDRYCIAPWNSPCGEQSGCNDSPIYDLSDPQTKYSMIAYGCAGYSRTLGGHKPGQPLDASSGFGANSQVNLHDYPFYYSRYVMWHGAQFRGIGAGQRRYWRKFLENIGLRQPELP